MRILRMTALLILSSLLMLLAACGKSAFGISENTGKQMTLTAENAAKDSFFIAGLLEADDGEEIVITSALKKGSIRVEIVAIPEEQSIDTLPSMDGEALLTADLHGTEEVSGTLPAGSYQLRAACLEKASGTVQIQVKPAEGSSALDSEAPSITTPEVAGAYLQVIDDLAARLGYDEAEASEGECLHGGFILDWDGDGVKELCLLLKTSPRENDSPDGTPLYGWYAPTFYLYTFKDGQAVRAGERDLYFSTAGREAAFAALSTEGGVQLLRWERSDFEEGTHVDCMMLSDDTLQKAEVPAEIAAAAEKAESVQAFLEALGTGQAQLLMINSSGEASIMWEANAQQLRADLTARAG